MIYPVISIRQPWAALIVNGYKNVENRNWRLPDLYHNCTVLVHASARPELNFADANAELNSRGFKGEKSYDAGTTLSGFIIGAVRFKDCVIADLNPTSPWCDVDSDFWWMIEKAMPILPVAAKGKLSFWKFDYPHEITFE